MVKFSFKKVQSDCLVLFITKTYTGFIKFYDTEPNTLIYALSEFIVIYYKIIVIRDTIFIIINLFSIIIFQGFIARLPYLCKNIPYLVCYLGIYGC